MLEKTCSIFQITVSNLQNLYTNYITLQIYIMVSEIFSETFFL